MKSNGQVIENILKNNTLKVDEVFNAFDNTLLLDLEKACIMLITKLGVEKMIVDSVEVKAIIKDDLNKVKNNLEVIRASQILKAKKIGNFCLN